MFELKRNLHQHLHSPKSLLIEFEQFDLINLKIEKHYHIMIC
jgi:hypothetical protein